MSKEDTYNLDTYNYSLPKELIAQYPLPKRDSSRLLLYKKDKKEISHHIFKDLPNLLNKDDVLVLNNTKVIRARFYVETRAQRSEVRGQSKEIEILLVSSVGPDNLTWKILAKPKKRLHAVETLYATSLQPIDVINPETIRFKTYKDLETILSKIGTMPLPPYIKRTGELENRPPSASLAPGGRTGEKEFSDFDRYQTVFAKEAGAVAAPTAALHFTNELLEKLALKDKGIEILYVTLHVGPGTFLPVRTNDIREHKLIPESFYIDSSVWERIQKAKKNKKRIIACGTTTVRALEYAAIINKLSGLNGLYIIPTFKFQVVDSLITNFHLPKTTLLMLVSAFIGWENVKKIYEEAIKEKYRFYSYGDAMFIT